MKILIIDDSEDDRLLYRRSLQKNSEMAYEFMEASDGEEGLRAVEEQTPACVLLDYSLPGHNGVEVLKRLREKHPFLPVVILTGQGNEAVAVAAMQEGAQNYISKQTITPEAIQRIVRTAVEHCSLEKRIHDQRTSLEIFTRALAHDLKEPVRTIKSYAELIVQKESFSEKAQTYFNYIETAADRMAMLIDTVFLYTRLEDPTQMHKELCNTGDVLQEVKDNLGHLIRENQAIITADPLPNVYVNRTQMMQLLQNLVSNAIRHSDPPIIVHLSAEEKEDHWLFSVSDNGCGIEEKYLQRVFEPFKRLGNYERDGAGLGLAICKKIIESHNGKIWCESAPGQGATFLFTLPKAMPEVTALPASLNKEAAKPIESGKTLASVLLVDDSNADIEITQFRLAEQAKLQCHFLVARSGQEALSILKQSDGAVDLVLLDVNMPEMDGFEVLEKMKKEEMFGDTNVIMCTGSTYDRDMERATSLGAKGYIVKPVQFETLQSAIRKTPNIKLQPEDQGYTLLRVA